MEILVADTNSSLRAALCERLTADGFTPVSVATGTGALRLLDSPRFVTVLLDWSFPDLDGVSVLREMRTRALDTPVMVLSTRGCVSDRVLALDSGADDYLLKPFHMDECMARVRRMVRTYQRQTPSQPGSGIRCIGDLTVDTDQHIATRGGKRLHLSAKESAILEYFACNANRIITCEELEQQVYQCSRDSGIIPVYIHYLRQKLDKGIRQKLLKTVRNAGYILGTVQNPLPAK